MGRANNFKEVTPVGLMRTPPPGLLKKSGVSGPSLPTSPDKENPPESPLGFPLKKVSISGASTTGSPEGKSKEAFPGSPLASPLKRPSISGPSFLGSPEAKPTEPVPESPAESPFNKKSSMSGASLSRGSIADSPSEFPFKRPSTSGASVSGSPTTHPKDTTPASPSGSSFKHSTSGASAFGSPQGTPKDIAPESPLALGDANQGPTEESPMPQSHIEDTLRALSGGDAVEEPSSTHDETEIQSPESQGPQTPAKPEDTIEPETTPTPRDPPKSLVSPKPNFSISTSSRGPVSPKPKSAQSPIIDFRANLKKREVVKETEKGKETDFRANLKKREVVKDSGQEKEPEFKNVFGRLKKAETRNYVAPDQLKGNILRGKAALNETGGPKKTERVDEFRKSLVMRKDEMKAGGGSIRRNTAGEQDAPKPSETVPEAIAVRQSMNRASSIKQNDVAEPISPVKSVGSRASVDRKPFSPTSSFKDMGSSRTSQEQEPLSPFPAGDGLDGPGWPLKSADASAPAVFQDQQPASPSPTIERADAKQEVAHAISDHQDTPELNIASQDESREIVAPVEPITEKEQSSPVAKPHPLRELPQAPAADATASPVQAAKNKLAGRINPALAGLLSRGPPAPEGPKKDLPITSAQSSPVPSAPLEHATKSRARGPKRRPPQAAAPVPSAQDLTKEVGAISCSDAIPSQTPPSPVESSEDDLDRFSQFDDSVPDTKSPRPESPVAEHLPIEPPTEQTPVEQLPVQQPSVEHSFIEETIAEQLSSDQLPTASSPVEPAHDEHPASEIPHAEEPISEKLPVEETPSEYLPVESFVAEQPSFEDFHTEETITKELPAREPSPELLPSASFVDDDPNANYFFPDEDRVEKFRAGAGAYEYPSSDESDAGRPSSETFYAEETVAERLPVRQPSFDFFPSEKDADELSLSEDSYAEDDVANSSIIEPRFSKELSAEQPAIEHPSIEAHSVEERPIDEPSAEVPKAVKPHVEPAVEQAHIEEPYIAEPSVESLHVEQPLVEAVPVEQIHIEEPHTEDLPVAQTSTTLPSTEQLPAEQTVKERQSVQSLPVEETIAEPVLAKETSPEPAAAEKVSIEQPSIEQNMEEEAAPPVPLKSEPARNKYPEPLQTRSLTTDFNIFPSRPSETSPRGPVSPAETSPLSGPPVPSKSNSPSTLSPSTPRSRWVQQNRYASPSPSPLRTSYNENRKDSVATQQSTSVASVASSLEALSRPVSHPSPPVPPKDAEVTLQKPVDPRRLSRKMSAPSLVAQASEAREVIAGFFKTFPNPQNRLDIDPQMLLMAKPDDSKIRTVKRHIWELTGDGRRQELPSHQEYILYQGSMYICVHVFEVGRSTTSEVYLWRGDDVPDTAVDSEQPFARKVARENSSKLQVILQGKEPTRFIQALGGIMITRRGSSSRHNSSALYMLCGRKHLGQMTFDEVDYSLRNLCSGFPYVVSAPFGKLYLWKGKGSGPEETGAARLIGMDLGLTGEFEEVSEGEEPEDFFDVFAGPREAAPHMCQTYWALKPKYSHFRTRLLRVDHELGQPTRFWNLRRPGSGSPVVKPNDCIQEIEPFCYRDIGEKDVYVLDTFFEIYV